MWDHSPTQPLQTPPAAAPVAATMLSGPTRARNTPTEPVVEALRVSDATSNASDHRGAFAVQPQQCCKSRRGCQRRPARCQRRAGGSPQPAWSVRLGRGVRRAQPERRWQDQHRFQTRKFWPSLRALSATQLTISYEPFFSGESGVWIWGLKHRIQTPIKNIKCFSEIY